jgi:hypothetical protein
MRLKRVALKKQGLFVFKVTVLDCILCDIDGVSWLD